MKLLSAFFINLFFLSVMPSMAQSNDYVAHEKDFGHYTSLVVDVQANIEVDASQPSHGTLVVSEADFENLKWELLGETLIISAKEGKSLAGPINLKLGSPNLARIESTHESIIYMHHVNGESLSLDLLKGTVKLEGKVENLHVMAEKGRLYGSGLESKSAEVRIWDEGSVVIHATESLEIEATNNGRVIYNGSPSKVTKSTSSGGVIMSEEALQQQREVEYVNFGV
ncbi:MULTISPECIES: GIN domain-containing protein [unclassified Imperialibacter]|uniref:GIN domain-containing protein n=1 Tax=unclassified Imperialibacter TaxID=2629706 RepID=UPI00125A462F|nr:MULTISPECIES: DUF2807 domain-containing protein [unclassified Imperialibacter]CAD5270841.1 exported hypothetical protein [Imperialibacter sp. 89]CAD5298457.1 exported hypothetical protein [Imperialibacter sp. 75]VVT34921.1 exported hypothetical protein [Imperialibacter sp. EC-SDR9]